MKVKMEKDYRKLYTLEDLDRAKAVINGMKEDESSAADMAEYAAGEIENHNRDFWSHVEVLKVEAHTARNCRVWNAYNDESQDMDVWIEFVLDFGNAIVKGGAYLTDIWNSGAVDYYDQMFLRIYREKE